MGNNHGFASEVSPRVCDGVEAVGPQDVFPEVPGDSFARVPGEFADHARDFASFVAASPTSYHCAEQMRARLLALGFKELCESVSEWSGAEGANFVVREGAVIAWVSPKRANLEQAGFRIVGSHTDSPALKLKPNPNATNYGWQQVGMEVYGGPLTHTWFDRDLGLAGRLTDLNSRTHLVRTGPILRISHLAPHLERSNGSNLSLDLQQHTMPIFSVDDPGLDIEAHLCEIAGIDKSDLAFYDVFTYPLEAPRVLGLKGEFLASGRMDNLSSVHASLAALAHLYEAKAGLNDVVVLAAFDHEEVGSSTRSGACGPFLEDVLRRIAYCLGFDENGYRAMLSRSTCISSDAGHGIHPNYPQKHDPNNRPLLGKGPLLKLNANQRYASDALGAAVWARACQAAGVPWQHFVSNNAVSCGTTIGPLTATRLGIVTVDVGVPLLSMHSVRELASPADLFYLSRALEAFWVGA